MRVNLGDIDVDKPRLYDRGPYTVRIKSIEEVTAQSGNLQLRIKTEFTDGKYVGKPLTDHITLVESCDWKLAKFLNACGVDIKALGAIDTESGQFRNVLNKLINKTVVWVVEHKTGRDDVLRSVVVDHQPDPNAVEEETPDFLKENVEPKPGWQEEEEK